MLASSYESESAGSRRRVHRPDKIFHGREWQKRAKSKAVSYDRGQSQAAPSSFCVFSNAMADLAAPGTFRPLHNLRSLFWSAQFILKKAPLIARSHPIAFT
jgi:hypothetical protein